MEKNTNSSGYNLYEVTPDEWILEVGNQLYVGTFKKVVKHAVNKMGFKLEELELAVNEMLKYDHNGAHFGMYRGFIYTFKKDLTKGYKNVKKAS